MGIYIHSLGLMPLVLSVPCCCGTKRAHRSQHDVVHIPCSVCLSLSLFSQSLPTTSRQRMELTYGVSCIKGEIHSVITLMRLHTRWANRSSSIARHGATTSWSYYDDDDDLISNFRRLNEYLEGMFDIQSVDSMCYVAPFHRIVVSQYASGPLTSATLSSLSKFALYGFFNSRFPRMKEAISLVAISIASCIFEETDWESDELILMKLLELSTLCFRCDAAKLLTVDAAWDVYCSCLSIHDHYRASRILKSEAQTTLVHLTLNVFSRASALTRVAELSESAAEKNSLNDNVTEGEPDFRHQFCSTELRDAAIDISKGQHSASNVTLNDLPGITVLMLRILKTISHMMSASSLHQSSDAAKFGLSLLNVALEAGGTSLSMIPSLVDVLRNDICRHLLRATQSEDLGIFSLSLRVVFNLFMSIKDHMKVQLEIFLSSVHLRLLDQSLLTAAGNSALSTAAKARAELVLESLLEFCREPALMLDIYTNYDCDVQCTNLFDAIITALCKRSTVDIPRLDTTISGSKSDRSGSTFALDSTTLTDRSLYVSTAIIRLTILHKLAFDGVLAILHSMTGKIPTNEGDAMRESMDVCLDDFVDTNGADHAHKDPRLEVLLEKEIDRWCDSQVDNDQDGNPMCQEDFEVYSLVTSNVPHSPIHPSQRTGQQSGLSNGSNGRSPSPFQPGSSSGEASPSNAPRNAASRVRRGSNSSASSTSSVAAALFVDRENECTSSAEARLRAADALRQRKSMKQKIKTIAELFNDKPLKQEWMKVALESQLLGNAQSGEVLSGDLLQILDPKAVALFLKSIPGLGKAQIGEFISKGPADMYPFHALVLQEYVKTFDFATVKGAFDKSLRMFLSAFRLPGEAQCIDRIMEAFAGRLFEQLEVGKPFANADAVFILSFSTIMLNTDLHNPHIPVHKKMTKEQFVRNNRGINDRNDLPSAYLENIYDEIKANQIQVRIDLLDSQANVDYSDSETWNKLMDRVAQDSPAKFTPTTMARRYPSRQIGYFSHAVDMFLVMAKPAFETILMLWQHAQDDLLLKRIAVGVHDYLHACSNLKLQSAFSSAIRVLLDSVKQYMAIARQANARRGQDKTALLSNRQTYQRWSKESGHDLKPLLVLPVERLLEFSEEAHWIDDQQDQYLDWSEAALVKSEFLLRVILRAMTQTSMVVHKETWSSLFELLLWARSRGALPHDLSHISTQFEEQSAMSTSYRPSEFAYKAYISAFELDSSSKNASKESMKLTATPSSGSWISLWWSGEGEIDTWDSQNSHVPLSLAPVDAAFREDPQRIVSNANAAGCFDSLGHHIRTDDVFLQMALEKCDLEIIFGSILSDASRRGESMFAGLLTVLGKTLAQLTGQSFEFKFAYEVMNNSMFEGSASLSEIFPTYLLEQKRDISPNCTELDAVVCLEWLVQLALSSDCAWVCFAAPLRDIFLSLLGDRHDDIFKAVPFVLERCIFLLFRCILYDFSKRKLNALMQDPNAFWSALRRVADLPTDVMPQLSGVIGSGVLSFLRASTVTYPHLKDMQSEDWHLLLGLLNHACSGWEGRCSVWECIGFLLTENRISDINFVAFRSLVVKFLDKHNRYSIGDWRKLTDQEVKERRSTQQEWTSNAMLYLLRLSLIALGGYIKVRQEQASHHTTEAHRYARIKLSPPEYFVFPDAHELKSQLFSPSKGEKKTSTAHSSTDSHSKDSHGLSIHSSVSARDPQQASWLSVPCIRLNRPEESLSIWIESVAILVDLANMPAVSLMHRALYCLEVLISSGNVASLPAHTWFKALDELASKLPLNLISASSKLQGMSHLEIQETCFRSCNLIFHLLVMHIWELRGLEHFPAMFIRAIGAMAANASICPKDSVAHQDMMGMIIALLRLLRLPEQYSAPAETIKASASISQSVPATESLESTESQSSSGFLGILQWMIAPAPQPLPKPSLVVATSGVQHSGSVSGALIDAEKSFEEMDRSSCPIVVSSLDHDGYLLVLTWRSICTMYPHLPTLIRSWDDQYFRSLQSAVELAELIKVRGESLAVSPSSPKTPSKPQSNTSKSSQDVVEAPTTTAANYTGSTAAADVVTPDTRKSSARPQPIPSSSTSSNRRPAAGISPIQIV